MNSTPSGLVLYDCATAPSPRRARILLAEKGVALETVQIDLRQGEQFNEAYRAVNPQCTVPALRTKSSFQDFFRGMRAGRMQALLERSCAGLADATEAEKALKVKKRMELLHEVLVDGT